MTIPVLDEAIIGWKVWKLDILSEVDVELRSSVYPLVLWPARKELKASCAENNVIYVGAQDRHTDLGYPTDVAPIEGCTCGIYAYRTQEKVLKHVPHIDFDYFYSREFILKDYTPYFSTPPPTSPSDTVRAICYGKAALWGKVFQFTDGYKAQYAYPYHIYLFKDVKFYQMDIKKLANIIRNKYVIDVSIYEAHTPEERKHLRVKRPLDKP